MKSFPKFRKYANNKSFFKIESDLEWTEIQLMGSKKLIHHFYAHQYPEKLFLHSLINFEMNGVVDSNETEFEHLINPY
jgi:hypothetical protein